MGLGKNGPASHARYFPQKKSKTLFWDKRMWAAGLGISIINETFCIGPICMNFKPKASEWKAVVKNIILRIFRKGHNNPNRTQSKKEY